MEGKMVFSNEALDMPMNNSLKELLPVDTESLALNRTFNHDDPMLAVVRFIFEVILTLSASLLGLAGNAISLGVLYRMKKRKLCSVATLLQILAFVDIVILLNNCLLRPFRYILLNTSYNTVHALIFPFSYAFTFTLSLINIWLTVILSWNRYQAVCNPLAVYTHPNNCIGNRYPFSQFFVLVIVSVAINIPRYFESRIKYLNEGQLYYITDLIDSKVYMFGYRCITFTLCHYIIPIGLLIFFNFKIISSLQNNAMNRMTEESKASEEIKVFVAGNEQKPPNTSALKLNKTKKSDKEKNGKTTRKKIQTRYKSLSESTASTTTTFTSLNVQPIHGALYDSSCVKEIDTMKSTKDLGEKNILNLAHSPGIEIPTEEKSNGKCNNILKVKTSSSKIQTQQIRQAGAVIAVTRMVLVVVVMSTICSVFTSVAHMLLIAQLTYFPSKKLDRFRRYYTVVSNFLGTINHSFNFVAYCLSSKNFRFIFNTWIQQFSENAYNFLTGYKRCCRRK